MNFIYILHSHFRWLVLLVAVITILLYLIGWLTKRKFSKIDTIMGTLFVSIIDLQVLLGIINLIIVASEVHQVQPKQAEHAGTMLCALGLVHLAARWKKKTDDVRFRNTALFYILALVLIVNGIIRMRGGLV